MHYDIVGFSFIHAFSMVNPGNTVKISGRKVRKAEEVLFILRCLTRSRAYAGRDQIFLVKENTNEMNTMVFKMKKLIETVVKTGWLVV